MIKKPIVGIIMGSDSDLVIMKETAEVLEEFGVNYEMTIISAHRTPQRMFDYAKTAVSRGLKVIIAGAGGAAAVPGMISAISTLPVIGVPIKSKALSGIDSLYSIVQMPSGVPTATVAINGAKNAGILAVQILALSDNKLQKKVLKYKETLKKQVNAKAEKLEKEGYTNYLNNLSKER